MVDGDLLYDWKFIAGNRKNPVIDLDDDDAGYEFTELLVV